MEHYRNTVLDGRSFKNPSNFELTNFRRDNPLDLLLRSCNGRPPWHVTTIRPDSYDRERAICKCPVFLVEQRISMPNNKHHRLISDPQGSSNQ
jgi:hypothetical protein